MPKDMKLAWQLCRDVVTDNAMESVAQVMAQRRIQVEREARDQRKKAEEERVKRERMAAFTREQEEEARKSAKATSDTETQGHPITVGLERGQCPLPNKQWI